MLTPSYKITGRIFLTIWIFLLPSITRAVDWQMQLQKITCKLLLARVWEIALPIQSDKNSNLVVVHPHEEFDIAKSAKAEIEAKLAHAKSGVILVFPVNRLLGDDLKTFTLMGNYPTYLDNTKFNSNFRTVKSFKGELKKISKYLPNFKDESVTTICGGIIGQCHRETFWNLLDYAVLHQFSHFSVRIPFRGTYFQTLWDETNSGTREYGVGNYPLLWRAPEPIKNSYTLNDIFRLNYLPGFGGKKGTHRLFSETFPHDIEATLKNNLDQIFLNYFLSDYVDKLNYPGVKIAPHFSMTDSDFQMRIVLNRNPK